jgi:SlyX protein
MTGGGAHEQSMEQVEIKIAYLERAMAELSDVVFRQQREIQALEALIEQLRERFEAAQTPEGPASLEQERPPHY